MGFEIRDGAIYPISDGKSTIIHHDLALPFNYCDSVISYRIPLSGSPIKFKVDEWEYDNQGRPKRRNSRYWDNLDQEWAFPYDFYVYTYDASNRLSGIYKYMEFSGGTIHPQIGYEYQYDGEGRLIRYTELDPSGVGLSWIVYHEEVWEYDTLGRIHRWHWATDPYYPAPHDEKIYTYNSTGTSMVMTYTTDMCSTLIEVDSCIVSGKLILQRKNYSYSTSNKLILLFKEDAEYNHADQIEVYIRATWQASSSSWLNHTRHEYDYSPQQKLVEKRSFHWDSSPPSWVNTELKTISYDEAGEPVKEEYKSWNQKVQAWVKTKRRSYERWPNQTMKCMGIYIWDAVLQAWRPDSLWEFEYGRNGNPSGEKLSFGYSSATNTLNLICQKSFRYELDESIVTAAIPPYYYGPTYTATIINPLKTVIQVNENHAGSQTNSICDQWVYYYRVSTTALSDSTSSEPLHIYPNPTSSVLHIQGSNLHADAVLLFDLNGRQLKHFGDIDIPATLDMSQFSAGVYLLSVQSGNEQYIEKVLLK